MIKKYATILSLLLTMVLYAQREIRGTVKDSSGEMLPSVSILIKNTSKGTSTDFDGNFKVTVQEGDVLEFSYIGFETLSITITNQTFLNVVLQEKSSLLEEVIITSLGIKKEKKALGYAATELKAKEINKVRSSNVLNSLAGKVAGLQVTGANNGVASSARVIIRGENSLNINSNQPLFILDGVPVNNRIFGVGGNVTDQADLPTDYGNGLSELNSDDFESVTVLKGAAASALYGSRAANGVVVITTKKGNKYQEGMGIEISSSTMFSSPLRLPDLQTQYGGGWAGTYASNFGTNYGPALDGSILLQELSLGEFVDRPFINRYDLNDFFRTGINLNNTVTLSGANDKGDFLFSYGNTYNEGIVPNTNLKGNSFRFNGGYQLTDELRVNLRANYITRGSDNLTVAGYGSQGIMYTLLWNYINVDLEDLRNYWNVPNQEQRRLFTWGDNPWFIVNENINAFDKNRFIGNVSLDYKLAENLSLLTRIGIDQSNDFRWSRRSIGAQRNPNGMYREQEIDFSEINADFLLTYEKEFGDFTTRTSLGGNRFDQKITEGFLQGNGLAIPGLYNSQNINVTPVLRNNVFEKRINSLYAFTNVGYKDYLYLDLSVRNDWSSTLPSDNNSYFYPAASVSFIASEAYELPEVIDFMKLRFNVAEVGKDTDPYSLSTAYNFGSLGGTLTNPAQLLNANLKPERTVSTEFGIEAVFFKNRINFDATYYSSTSRDQILNVGISGANGFNSIVANAGEIKNSGIELSLGLKPVKTEDVLWELTANFTKNTSKIVSLLGDLDTFIIGQGPSGVTVEARPGQQMGDIYGDRYIRNDQGQIIYENGLPLTGNRGKVGNYNPDWTLGLGTTFTYKNFSVSAQFDIRHGGEIYSYTNAIGRESGILEFTLPWRENGVVGEGVVSDGSGGYVPNTERVTAESWAYAVPRGNAEANIFDASFVKLRQLSLGYSFPKTITNKIGFQELSLSLVGSNLFLWTDVPNIDPEAQGLNQGTLLPGFEVTQLPSNKSYGFKINMTL